MDSDQDDPPYDNQPIVPDIQLPIVVNPKTAPRTLRGRSIKWLRAKANRPPRPWPCNFCLPNRKYSSRKTLLKHLRIHITRDHSSLVHTDPRVVETLDRYNRAGSEIPSELCSVCLDFHHGTPFYRCTMLREIKAGRRRLSPGTCPICLRIMAVHRHGQRCWWIIGRMREWKDIRCRTHHQKHHLICQECPEKNPTTRASLVGGVDLIEGRSEFPKVIPNRITKRREETELNLLFSPEPVVVSTCKSRLELRQNSTVADRVQRTRPPLHNPIREITLDPPIVSKVSLENSLIAGESSRSVEFTHSADLPSTDIPQWREGELSSFLGTL